MKKIENQCIFIGQGTNKYNGPNIYNDTDLLVNTSYGFDEATGVESQISDFSIKLSGDSYKLSYIYGTSVELRKTMLLCN